MTMSAKVAQKFMMSDKNTFCTVGESARMTAVPTPTTHNTVVLYTQRAIPLLSLRASIVTCR